MLPWEHVAVGYLLYSLVVHALRGHRPTGLPVVVVGVASVLPDLIDKPLGWWLNVLPSLGLGHSVFFAVALVSLVWAFAGGLYATPLGIGVVSHLVGDVFYKAVVAGRLEWKFLLWPLVEQPTSEGTAFLSQFWHWMGFYMEFITSPQGMAYLGFEIALLGTAFLLWIYDGFPGVAPGSFRREPEAAGEY